MFLAAQKKSVLLLPVAMTAARRSVVYMGLFCASVSASLYALNDNTNNDQSQSQSQGRDRSRDWSRDWMPAAQRWKLSPLMSNASCAQLLSEQHIQNQNQIYHRQQAQKAQNEGALPDLIDEYLDELAEDELDDFFHLGASIASSKETVQVNSMLKTFRDRARNEHDLSEKFMAEVFADHGIRDERIAGRLFAMMDRNHDGILQFSEIAAVLCLFASGATQKRYKFLFRCLDLDGDGHVDKEEFRSSLTAILATRYHMAGIDDPYDPDEIFENIKMDEYNTVAKFKANHIVRDIFLVADMNRDGVLSMKEFLYWCRRGNREVQLLENALNFLSE